MDVPRGETSILRSQSMSYTSGGHTVFHHRYHIVWITKYRVKGSVVTSGADGVPGLAQALLGAAFLGSGLLLHQERQHHGRCHTSVSSGARTYRRQPVVIQFTAVGHRDMHRYPQAKRQHACSSWCVEMLS